MQALPDTPQIREIQRLTRDALRQIGRQNRLHLFPTTAGLPLNRRDTRKQIKATTHVANPRLGTKIKAIMLVLREAMTDTLMTHRTSSTPNAMDDLQMKLIDSQLSART